MQAAGSCAAGVGGAYFCALRPSARPSLSVQRSVRLYRLQESALMAWKLTDAKNPHESELDKIFESAKKEGPRSYLFVVLAYNACLRVSELIHVKPSDFNWTSGKMSLIPLKKAGLRRIKQADGTFKTVDRPLPDPVEYPLPSSTIELVRKYIAANKLSGKAWLFPGGVTIG